MLPVRLRIPAVLVIAAVLLGSLWSLLWETRDRAGQTGQTAEAVVISRVINARSTWSGMFLKMADGRTVFANPPYGSDGVPALPRNEHVRIWYVVGRSGQIYVDAVAALPRASPTASVAHAGSPLRKN